MQSAVDRLTVKLARKAYVPAHISHTDRGKSFQVSGYWREIMGVRDAGAIPGFGPFLMHEDVKALGKRYGRSPKQVARDAASLGVRVLSKHPQTYGEIAREAKSRGVDIVPSPSGPPRARPTNTYINPDPHGLEARDPKAFLRMQDALEAAAVRGVIHLKDLHTIARQFGASDDEAIHALRTHPAGWFTVRGTRRHVDVVLSGAMVARLARALA